MDFMKSNLIEPLKEEQTARDKEEERAHQPAACPVPSIKLLTERTSTPPPALQELYAQRSDAYYHWGINE